LSIRPKTSFYTLECTYELSVLGRLSKTDGHKCINSLSLSGVAAIEDQKSNWMKFDAVRRSVLWY